MELAKKIVAGEEVEKQIYIKEMVFGKNSNFNKIADRGYC